MGSQAIQSKFWGQQAADWATIQEHTGKAGYDFALNFLSGKPTTTLLDIGCGSGYFSKMANDAGMKVTGLDATPQLIEEAKKRLPSGIFMVGEMEELPFGDKSFDVVAGFNSFQYAASIKNAFAEARRVLKDSGNLVAMVWGNKVDCEAAAYLKAVGSMLPPPPPGAPGPFALSEDQLLERSLEEAGLKILENKDVDTIWRYDNVEIALKGLMSAGPAARAIENSGFDKTKAAILDSMQPYIQSNGSVIYKNKNRVVIAEKA